MDILTKIFYKIFLSTPSVGRATIRGIVLKR